MAPHNNAREVWSSRKWATLYFMPYIGGFLLIFDAGLQDSLFTASSIFSVHIIILSKDLDT